MVLLGKTAFAYYRSLLQPITEVTDKLQPTTKLYYKVNFFKGRIDQLKRKYVFLGATPRKTLPTIWSPYSEYYKRKKKLLFNQVAILHFFFFLIGIHSI